MFSPDVHEIKEFSWLNPNCTILSLGTVRLNLDFGQKHSFECDFHVLPDIGMNIIGIGAMRYYNIILDPKNDQVIFGNDFDPNLPETLSPKTIGRILDPDHDTNCAGIVGSISGKDLQQSLHTDSPIFEEDFPDLKQREPLNLPEIPLKPVAPVHDILTSTPEERLSQLPGIDERIKTLLLKYADITCSLTQFKKGGVPNVTFHITLTTSRPIWHRTRRVAYALRELFRQTLIRYEKLGIIVRCGPTKYSQPVLVVKKKNKNQCRIVLDLREINSITVPEKYAIPSVDDLLNKIPKDSKLFTSVDLRDAYFLINASGQTQENMCFSTEFGSYCLTKMPQGSLNAAEFFQFSIGSLFSNIPGVMVYLDDVIVTSYCEEEHFQKLDQIFSIMYDNNLVINPAKCEWMKTSITFLGHVVSAEGLKPLRDRGIAIRNAKLPSTHSELRAYIGSYNFLRGYQRKPAECLKLLHELVDHTKKRHKLNWREDRYIQAFLHSKEILSEAVCLQIHDSSLPIHVFTDASDIALGGVLMQIRTADDGDQIHEPLAFCGKPLNPIEQKHSFFLKELYSILFALRHFHYYVANRSFHLFSDNQGVVSLLTTASIDNILPRYYRIMEKILQYAPTIHHIPGKENIISDLLSRFLVYKNNPLPPVPKTVIPDDACFIGLISKTDLGEDLLRLAVEQPKDTELQNLIANYSGPKMELISRPIDQTDLTLIGEIGGTGSFRPYVTKNMRQHFWGKCHNTLHQGIKRTIKQVSQLYYWPTLKRDVTVYTRCCETCQKFKYSKRDKVQLQIFKCPKAKFAVWHLDFATSLPIFNGYQHILCLIDRFTRFRVLIPMRDMLSQSVIFQIMHRIVAPFGTPNALISDNQTSLVSKEVKNFFKCLGILTPTIPAFAPWVNGLAESLVGLCKRSLMTSNIDLNWPLALPLVNVMLNQLDGDFCASASQLAFGQASHVPGSMLFADYDYQFSTEYARDIMHFARNAKSVESREHPILATQDVGLDDASHVYVRSGPKPRGFSPRYSGPHPVIRMGKSTADVSINDKTYLIARERLKKAHLLPLLYEFAQIHMPKLQRITASTEAPVDFNDFDKEVSDYYERFSYDLASTNSAPYTTQQAAASKTTTLSHSGVDVPDIELGPSTSLMQRQVTSSSGITANRVSDNPSIDDKPTESPVTVTKTPQNVRRTTRHSNPPDRFGVGFDYQSESD